MESSFGPSALITPANGVTFGRFLVTPLLLVMVLAGGGSWLAVALWIALASTDGLDGYLARRHGTTTSGAFLDPLADKFLVLSAMAVLVIKGLLWWLPVTLIAAREIAMSAYRAWFCRVGISIPARTSAKVKTVVQDVAVGMALAPIGGRFWLRLTSLVVWMAVLLTLATGWQYVQDRSRKRGPFHAV